MNFINKYLKYKKKYIIKKAGSKKDDVQYKLIIQPYISATDKLSNSFGYYYTEKDDQNNRDDDTFIELENSNNDLKKASAEISWIWLETCKKQIFKEIGNFEYLLDLMVKETYAQQSAIRIRKRIYRSPIRSWTVVIAHCHLFSCCCLICMFCILD